MDYMKSPLAIFFCLFNAKFYLFLSFLVNRNENECCRFKSNFDSNALKMKATDSVFCFLRIVIEYAQVTTTGLEPKTT